MADGKVVISTALDNKGFKNGIAGLKNDCGGLKSAFQGLGKAITAAFAVKALVGFGKQAVETASNLQEVQNVVDTAFGEMAYKVEAFADSAIDKFGMSELSAKKTASSYMAMAKSMGFSSDTASDMAISLAQLSGDVASFYNISQELADTKLKSVFTGETETLKDLGVVMTQVNLQQFAYNQGINKSVDKMSQAELVALRYKYVTQQLGMAQGDFAKTSGSWANQTRILSERWKEFMGIIGNGLIQVLTPFVQFLNAALSRLIQIAKAVSKAFSAVFGKSSESSSKSSGMSSVASDTEAAAEAQNDLAANTEKAGKAAQKAIMGFDELNVISDPASSSSSSGTGGASVGALDLDIDTGSFDTAEDAADGLADKIKGVIDDISTYFSTNFGPSISAWGDAFGNIVPAAQDAFGRVKTSVGNLWNNSLAPFGNYLLNDFVPGIVNSFSTTFAPIFSETMVWALDEFATHFDWMCQKIGQIINDVLMPVLEVFKTVWTDVMGVISSVWDSTGGRLLELLNGTIESFRQIWDNLYNNIFKPIWDNIIKNVSEFWEQHGKPLFENIVNFFAKLGECIMTVWNNFLSPIVNWLIETFGPLVSGVFNGVMDVIWTVVGVVADVIGGVLKALGGLLDFITGVFSGDWKKAWQGICDFFQGIWDAIWGIVRGVVNLIIDGINLLWRGIYRAVSAIVNGIGSIAGAIGSLLGQDWKFSMPKNPPLIPKLAQGAVIPANREFLAVLGDQSHGRNLEAPEGLIRQIVREESGAGANTRVVVLLERLLDEIRNNQYQVVMSTGELVGAMNRHNSTLSRRFNG